MLTSIFYLINCQIPERGGHGVSGNVSPSQAAEDRQRDSLPSLQKKSGHIHHPFPSSPGELYQQRDPAGGAGRGILFCDPEEDGYRRNPQRSGIRRRGFHERGFCVHCGGKAG